MVEKTRSFGTASYTNTGWTKLYTGAYASGSPWTQSVSVELGSEHILYGEGSASGRRRFNPCSHSKSEYSPQASSYTVGYQPTCSTSSTSFSGYLTYLPTTIMDVESMAFAARPSLPALDADFKRRAVTSMLSLVPTPLLLPNFLYELRDAKSLLNIAELTRRHRDALVNPGNPVMISSGKTVVDTGRKARQSISRRTKVLADDWLTYTYGWKPFLSELQTMALEYSDFQRRYREWVAWCQKPVRRYYAEDDTLTWDSRSSVPQAATQCGTFNYLWAYGDTTVTRTASACLQWKPHLTLPQWISQYLGLHNALSVGWEAIPLSFVVDWAFDVGGAIQHAEVLSNRPPDLKVLWSGLSIKQASTAVLGITRDLHKTRVVCTGGTLTHKSYERHTDETYLNWVPGIETRVELSYARLASALALIRQRIRL